MDLIIFKISFHKFHIVTLRPWPLFISILILCLVLNILVFFKTSKFIFFLFLFILGFIFSFNWWRDVNREREIGFHNFEVRDGFKWGIILFIFSEVLFFRAWFWAFFHNRLNPGNDLGSSWPPFNIFSIEPFQVPLLNTSILLIRGVTVTWAHHNLFSRKDRNFSLISTILLGIIFTSFQGIEYIESSFSLRENCYGSSFFVTTGFHGIHVIIGTIFLTFCLKLNLLKNINKWQHTRFEFAIWYWHFVDVVWLFLFFFLYWWSF